MYTVHRLNSYTKVNFSEILQYNIWWASFVVLQGRSWMTWRSSWRDAPTASAPLAPPCRSLKRPAWKPRPSQWPPSQVHALTGATHMHIVYMHRHVVSPPRDMWFKMASDWASHHVLALHSTELLFWKVNPFQTQMFKSSCHIWSIIVFIWI